MTPITSLDNLIYTVIGAILLWLGRVVTKWWNTSTQERRGKVDAQAKAERRNRLLTESLHDHRNAMLKSGECHPPESSLQADTRGTTKMFQEV